MGESACQAPAGQLAFSPCPADIGAREVGGGRATRQPGQVRKEAALTSAVRVARQPPTLSFRLKHPAPAPRGASAAASKGDGTPVILQGRPHGGFEPRDDVLSN